MSRTPYQMKRNPRKISLEAAEALVAHRPFKRDNTVVQVGPVSSTLYLHGSAIAMMLYDELYITDAGYLSSTTKERLNALPGVRVHTSKGQRYLNGKKWDGGSPDWTRVDEHIDNPRRRKNSYGTGGYTVAIPLSVYNVYQQYWEGQGDPLYAVLSRRPVARSGRPDPGIPKMEVSEREMDRLQEVSLTIMRESSDPMHYRTAETMMMRHILEAKFPD
jgi:hypothetical protein